MLDIKDKSCDEVFANFKSKWRYNIRLAMRKGVECKFCGEDELDDFMELMKETGRRDGFEIRSEEYFRNFLQAFHGNAKLCIAKLDGKVLSGALLVNYANVASYVYGCSSNEYRKYMPNYLMQWTMIKYAIESGCRTYDFAVFPIGMTKRIKTTVYIALNRDLTAKSKPMPASLTMFSETE